MSEDTYIDLDALLEELRNLPPPTETYAFFTETEPGIAFLDDQLYGIFNGFLAQFFTPDITTFASTCDSLIPVLDLALLTAKNRQLVSDILELADVMFDKFVSVSLTLQQCLDPQHIVPTHSMVRTRLLDIINQCLASPHDISDIRSELQTLQSKIQEDQAKADLFSCDTQWINDLSELWPEFKALNSCLTEDIPAATLEIVAQGCTSTGPTEVLPTTTAQLRRNSSMIMDNLRASKSTRPLGASQSLSALPTSASCHINGIPKRGASISRTQSLSAMLPAQAQARVLVALGTVTEEEEEED
ncbi:hypothetical protein DFJ58DRAFT_419316 [Suillus subalutaceus]|uniref:uncharacterized protein n=1 Tax=Suillus subalutaceus TaxID=48586 RepID=UPI001B861C46|nr:uncharacterized protein DFJ58DRAFT_419316 [Suillus subalutaceus]KAG1851866.1 hypothetical protein DFJ58DRAFT_419316 [Suillus subalutaceus]